MNLKIGCCGFPRTMDEYFKKFGAVEVQKTFFRVPADEIAKKWRQSAPDDFEFTLKACQLITHDLSSPTYTRKNRKKYDAAKDKIGFFRPTEEVFRAWADIERVATVLHAKIILFDSPDNFLPSKENKEHMHAFFAAVSSRRFTFVWDPPSSWGEEEVRRTCAEAGLVHCADPFKTKVLSGDMRYFHLNGIGGNRNKYKGLDLKLLRDFCEDQARQIKKKPLYLFFNNAYRMTDAERFGWIAAHTGRMKSARLDFLKEVCRNLDIAEEDEAVQKLSLEAEKIVTLILHTDYAKVDIDIEKEKLRELCRGLFPGKEYLYDMIYGNRFDRLWEQFRDKKEEE